MATASQPVMATANQPVKTIVSQPTMATASQPASHGQIQPNNEPAMTTASQPCDHPVSHHATQPISQPASRPWTSYLLTQLAVDMAGWSWLVIMDTTIRGVTSASVSIEWMGPALLVEVFHEAYARNLQKMTQIDQFHVKVSPHRSLNTRKGVAKFDRAATDMSNEEVRDALNSSPRNRDMPFVAEAYRVSANRNNGKQPTGTFFLTFHGTTLPKKIQLGFEQFDVHLYVASPRRCFKCQKFGHNTRVCRAREEVCQTCATPGHSKDTCPNSDNPKCLNCKGSHTAWDRDCPRFVAEKAALQIQAESHCSLVDARKKVEPTSATTNKEPDSASTPEQRNSYFSEENARLREIISTLRKDNASMQQRLDDYEKRLSNLKKSRVVDTHPDSWHLHRRCPNQHSISCGKYPQPK